MKRPGGRQPKVPVPEGMYRDHANGKLHKRRPPVTQKEKKFLKAFIETGDQGEAAMIAYDVTERKNASAIGGAVLRKLDITEVMEKHGLSDDFLVGKMLEGLESANKIHGTSDDFIEVPDYAVRHKYLETAFKLKGYWGDRMKIAMEKDGEKIRILLDLPTNK